MSVHISCDQHNHVALSVGNQINVLCRGDVLFQHTNKLTVDQENAPNQEKHDEGFISHTFSDGEKYFAVVTENKKLLVWKLAEKRLCCSIDINKRPTCLGFCHKEDTVIVGDKSGDVYRCVLEDEKATLLLGHLSMVLDLVMTNNDEFVITADRDEKIRVSKYPNAYTIHSFCLAHTRLVSSIDLLKSDRLVSTSTDRTLRLWDYREGMEVTAAKTFEDPFTPSRVACHENIVAVIGEGSSEVCFYHTASNILTHKQTVKLHAIPFDMCFRCNGDLLVMVRESDKPLVILRQHNEVFENVSSNELSPLYTGLRTKIDTVPLPSAISELTKPEHFKRASETMVITPGHSITIGSATAAKLPRLLEDGPVNGRNIDVL